MKETSNNTIKTDDSASDLMSELGITKEKKRLISLRRLIALTFLGLFAVVQITLMIANYWTSKNTVEDRINSDLDQSVTTFQHIIEDQLLHLHLQADLLSKDFGFKQAIATADNGTIQSALQNIQSRANADIAFVLDLDGGVMALVNGNTEFTLPKAMNTDDLIDLAEEHSDSPWFMAIGDKLYQMSLAPVQAPVLIGVVAIGKSLDDEHAKLIQSYSSPDLDVAFIHKIDDNNDWLISGQTENGHVINDYLQKRIDRIATEGNETVEFGGDTYSVRAIPLAGEGSDNKRYLLFFTSLDHAMSKYTFMFVTLIAIGILGFGMMFIGGYIISDRISAPIRTLVDAAAGIAGGDYHSLKLKGNFREVFRLQNSFNAMISAVKEREDKISYQAFNDVETGLPNGQYLTREAETKLARSERFSLVIIEIREFHNFRTVLEYNQINQLVSQAGKRLSRLTGVATARLSSDSFGLIIENPDLAQTLMAGIVDAFMTPFTVADMTVDVNLHIGFCMAPDDGTSYEELSLNAHAALDEARSKGLDYVQACANYRSAREKHLSLMSDLRTEINQGHVAFHYQPKLLLETSKIYGAEALIRWNSPKHGFVPPDQFIGMAERTGDIRHLTSWGLGQIVEQAGHFKNAGLDLMIAANLSTHDLQNESLPDLLRMITTEHDVSTRNICLEVTESAVMGDTKRALKILNQLSDMGFYLSIDDYGTGYSSLAYIKSLPVHELKIDKAFVLKLATSAEDQILVQSTIELAHNLGMKVVAEGVEDAESLALLKQYGCDSAQGYYISKAIPSDAFTKFWSDHNG